MKYKFLINAHNGGEDIGTVKDNLRTKELNLKISKTLSEKLNDLNIPNQLVRENDETISLKERTNFINNSKKDDKEIIVLSIDSSFGNNTNSEVIYSLKENGILAKRIAREFSDIENNLKEAYQKRLPINPNKDYHFLLRETDVIPVIIKLNFKNEERNFNLEEEWRKYSDALLKAITKFLGVEYISEEKKGYYKVQKGDTLWSVAKKFNISVETIKRLNNLPNNLIKVNQVIKIEEIEEVYEKPTKEITYVSYEEEEPIQEEILHTVSENESIYQIADFYNISTDDIKNANNLISEEINKGQILLIPKN